MTLSRVLGSVGKGANAAFALTILALAVSAALSYRNIVQLAENNGWVVHTQEVLDGLRDMPAALTEAESAQRAYIITGDAGYLAVYGSALTKAQATAANVRTLTVDNPAQVARVPALLQQVEARASTLARGVEARRLNGAEAGREFIASGEGRQQMDAMRAILGEMEGAENALLEVRMRQSTQSYRTAIATVIVSALLGLGLVVVVYTVAARELATRLRAAQDLKDANEALEERVRARTADLAETNASLQRSNRELEQFASVASHDLQEPLRKIQAFGDRLHSKYADSLPEQAGDYVTRMQASATRMRSLIDGLLSFSRVTTKGQPFLPVDLAEVAREVAGDLEERVHQVAGTIEVGELPTVDADPLQMRQLLQNLVGNALKFRRPDVPPVVRVRGSMEEGGRCRVTVEDNGIGFEEVYLDRIFELFQRLHGRHDYEGTGMGLAICKRIVERHGGTITASSAPGRGSTFIVTLPIRQRTETIT